MNYGLKYLGFIILVLLLFGILNVFVAKENHSLVVNIPTANAAGDTGGLIPCGHGSDPNNRCTLCDLFVGIGRIIDWGRNILVAVALAALVIGGIMYIVSAGNQQMMESAKNVIKQALIGVAIVLGAWLIINTIIWLLVVKSDMGVGAGNWWNFDCGGGANGGIDVVSAISGDSRERENQIRSVLNEFDISVNNPACEIGTSCTNLDGTRLETLDRIIAFAQNVNVPIVITGGTEDGHSNRTEYSHANGYKIDIRPSSEIDNYITNNYQNVGVRSDGATVYSDGNGNYYAREGNHWDICYNCPNPISSGNSGNNNDASVNRGESIVNSAINNNATTVPN